MSISRHLAEITKDCMNGVLSCQVNYFHQFKLIFDLNYEEVRENFFYQSKLYNKNLYCTSVNLNKKLPQLVSSNKNVCQNMTNKILELINIRVLFKLIYKY